MMTHFCKKCGVELTTENWYPLDRRDNWYICHNCRKAYLRKKYRTGGKKKQKERLMKQTPEEKANRLKQMSDWGKTHRLEQRVGRYGLTEEEFKTMFDKQGGACALCGGLFVITARPDVMGIPPTIDHDHKTGEVRGLLCANCNKGLGFFFDDITLLSKAIAYLQKLKVKQSGE
jgi:hypothetical protein